MTNGFYNTDNFSITEVKHFCSDAINLAYIVRCESIIGWKRQIVKTLNIKQFIIDATKVDYKLYIIDRYKNRQREISKELSEYEICLNYNSNFLYIMVNEENFNKLIKQYDLKLKEWN